jgi:predicted amidohydrolase
MKIALAQMQSVGGFESAGTSSVWNLQGKLIAQLSKNQEGFLIYDTDNERISN